MQGLVSIKTYFFRFLAVVLLALNAGFAVAPESSPFSEHKTFVKTHPPAADGFVMLLHADDKEDLDEDGAMDVQLAYPLFTFLSCTTVANSFKVRVRPLSKENGYHVYLAHRQLII